MKTYEVVTSERAAIPVRLPTSPFLGWPFRSGGQSNSSRMECLSSIPGLASVTQITGGRDIGHPRKGIAADLVDRDGSLREHVFQD